MNLLIKNIKQLVTVCAGGKPFKCGKEMLDLGIIENGTVLIENGVFAWIGPDAEFAQTTDEDLDVIDGSEMTALPGFVDSNTHLLFSGTCGNNFTESEESKVLAIIQATRAATKKELKRLARRHLEAMLSQGTTTVEIKSGYGLNENTEIKMLGAINDLSEESLIDIIPVFVTGQMLPAELKEDQDNYFDVVCSRIIPYIARRKMAGYCDILCDPKFCPDNQFKKITEAAKSYGIHIKIHANCSLQSAAGLDAISASGLNHISDTDITKLKRSGMIASVLPGDSFFTNSEYAPARKIIDAGIPLAIASGFNPVSCMSHSMPLAMTISCAQMSLTPEEAITAATLNGAAALGLSEKIGSIETGKQADIVLYNVPNYRYLLYHFGMNHAAKVVKRGTYLDF